MNIYIANVPESDEFLAELEGLLGKTTATKSRRYDVERIARAEEICAAVDELESLNLARSYTSSAETCLLAELPNVGAARAYLKAALDQLNRLLPNDI